MACIHQNTRIFTACFAPHFFIKNMETRDKINELRKLMKDRSLDAYIIPPTDPHQNEYTPDYWKTLQWISGFTGSAGTLLVTENFAGLWTDSRYFIQAEEELKNTGIELVKLKIPYAAEYVQWLEKNLNVGQTIGMDGKTVAQSMVYQLKKEVLSKGLKINCTFDLPGMLWEDRPILPDSPVFEHKPGYAGMSLGEKLLKVREEMYSSKISHHLLTALDDIAWLLNLRGKDVEYNPVFFAYMLISKDLATLFIDHKKIPDAINEKLIHDNIHIAPYESLEEHLSALDQTSTVLLSTKKISHHNYSCIPSHCEKIDGLSIPARLKAIKNTTELSNIRNAMIKDGAALVRFFYWLENHIGREEITEYGIVEQLQRFREEQAGYIGDSFHTIAGYKEHGAVVHYIVKKETAYTLKPEGMLLLDSGAQYIDGTTDITRTVCLGKPTEEQKITYTYILKGLISLSMAIFPEGTKGFQLDALARMPLWQQGKNYGHGTGHGIGYFLNVHEGPQGISPNPGNNFPLQPGMIQSNEPGFYKEGDFGIRLENLIVVVPHKETSCGKFMKFETLTLFPFEASLIDKDLLSTDEQQWINEYHQQVFENLSHRLGKQENQWLLEKTKRI